MSKQPTNQMMSKDQLQRIVRTIVMHDVTPQMKLQSSKKPVETCRVVMDTLNLNFSGQFDTKAAREMIFAEILE